MYRLVGTALLLLLTAFPVGGAADPADAAFESGDYDRALELYDARLAADPADVGALVRSGMLLSWRNAYAEAVARYDRALALDPRQPTASLERAKVLSWDRRFPEAIDGFARYLEEHPGDREARLALARCLSWDRRYAESREQLAFVLAAEPDHHDAMVGTARTYAWAGDLRGARVWYERALEADPDSKDARVGLAYLDLWTGDAEGADRRAHVLGQRWPDDPEVAELAERTAEATAPRAWFGLERITDTDGNELDVLRLDGGPLAIGGVGVGLALAHWELANGDAHATVDTLVARAAWRPGPGQSIDAHAGLSRADNDINGRTDNAAIGGLAYARGLDRRWQVTASLGRQPLIYSPRIASNDILIDQLTAGARGRVADRWRPWAEVAAADFSDGNRRALLRAGVDYELPLERPELSVGYVFTFMDYDEDTASGYFDPQGFRSSLLRARVSGRFGRRSNTWRAEAETGLQSFELGGVGVSNDAVIVLAGAVGFPLGRGFTLEVEAGWGTYAALTTAGFESRRAGLRLRWRGER